MKKRQEIARLLPNAMENYLGRQQIDVYGSCIGAQHCAKRGETWNAFFKLYCMDTGRRGEGWVDVLGILLAEPEQVR